MTTETKETMDELLTLKKLVNTYSALIFRIGMVALTVSTFFLFTSLTTDSFDTPKFLALLIFTAIALILLMLKFTIDGKVVLIRTPLDLPLLLLLAVGIVSTFLSSSLYVSLLGNSLRVNGSLVGIITLVLFYFVLVNFFKNLREIKWILSLIVFLGQVLAVVTLLAYAGVKFLPGPWVIGPNFTPTGSSFSTTAILALLLPLIVIQITKSSKPFIILNSLFLALSGITIALTGTWATWIAALVGVGLSLISYLGKLRNLSHLKPLSLISLAVPSAVIALSLILSLVPPMGKAQNPLYDAAKNFPREAQLSLTNSWKISVSAFRDAPFWGSGPATYLFDFTNYKPIEFNSLKTWNLRFDTSFNEYLQTLATLGSVGLLALLSATALFVSAAFPVIARSKATRQSSSTTEDSSLIAQNDRKGGNDNEKVALAISGLLFFLILILHSATLVVWIMGLIILAAFMVASLADNPGLSASFKQGLNDGVSGDIKKVFLRIAGNISSSSEETIRVDALPGVLLTIAIAAVLFAGYFGAKFALADYHHRLALNAVSQNNGIAAYNELVTAEKLNPLSDSYRTDLAQVNFALANAVAAAKGPTEASPAGTLTDADKQNISVLLQQSINEGRAATTLNPKSAVNWEILGLLYRQIAGVAQNALVFSLDAYGRAIFQDPLNPNLRVSVGGVYYAVKNFDMAIRFFTDAINLKPDFANAYYNLSVALRDKGDLANAEVLAEKLLTLIPASSPDYKTASDYLNDLKSKNTSAQEQPPAAQAKGALQQKGLPKVVNVGNPPEKIATPEAIKKPPVTTPTPTATSTPEPTPTATP